MVERICPLFRRWSIAHLRRAILAHEFVPETRRRNAVLGRRLIDADFENSILDFV